MEKDIILEVRNLSKEFPGVKALDNVNMTLKRGEIHAICGENGAGKSTLIKILSGVHDCSSYEGEIVLNGEVQKFRNLKEAELKGIVCIHQELALVPELNVAENVYLGGQPNIMGVVQWNEMYSKTKELIESIGISTSRETGINPQTPIKFLSIQKQQIVEILKALSKNARILILDEPTASLTEEEVDSLMNMMNILKERGVTCIYISHKLDEVMRIADTVTVLRDGQTIETRAMENFTKNEIISLMVGRTLDKLFPREEHVRGEAKFEIKNYTVCHPDILGKSLLYDVNLTAYENEILGISGLMGSGRTELFASIFGALDAKATGEVYIDNKKVKFKNPRKALDSGMVIVTEDRKKYGLVLGMSVMENTTMSNMKAISKYGFLNTNEEMKETNMAVDYFKIKTHSIATKVQNLSGGNQQKVVLGKAMLCKPKVLILDEPTRGIDVGAKYEIYKIMNQLVKEGVVVIMISSDMEEILGMSDRIVVFNEGKVKGELSYTEATQQKILTMAEGGN